MTKYSKTFKCDSCNCRNFSKEYSFMVEFRSVNFTDDLIFTECNKEIYVCKDCGKKYDENEMKESVKNMIKAYKEDN